MTPCSNWKQMVLKSIDSCASAPQLIHHCHCGGCVFICCNVEILGGFLLAICICSLIDGL
jgi:hypothetical protein